MRLLLTGDAQAAACSSVRSLLGKTTVVDRAPEVLLLRKRQLWC